MKFLRVLWGYRQPMFETKCLTLYFETSVLSSFPAAEST
ncbi:hypothetical protein D3OALGA1CA_3749 [Olavius algarvensis associated proteobacterium Delta 3]|nr:hypothetical protein D3OALGA1CA_3749 [Olavius algarvensis associated proteobacterium Delta 3]